MNMNRSLFVPCVTWMCLVLLSGCGDDDDSPKDAGTNDAGGNDGGGGMGGKTAGRSGGAGQVGSVQCGTMTCTSNPQAMGFITACCADATTNTCGSSMMGGPCSKPVVGDSRCPSINFMGGAFSLPACCDQNNMCGIDPSMFGMPGCVELSDAAARAMMDGQGAAMGIVIDFPSPRTCDAADLDGGPEDAGN